MCRGAATKSVLDQQLTTVLGSREPQDSFRHSDRPPGGSAQKKWTTLASGAASADRLQAVGGFQLAASRSPGPRVDNWAGWW